MKVSEWQVAMAAMKGDSTGRSDGSCTGSAWNFESSDGSTPQRFSPSSVKVPVCRNNNLYVFKILFNIQNKRQNTVCLFYITNKGTLWTIQT
jgi:hypothetical protein